MSVLCAACSIGKPLKDRQCAPIASIPPASGLAPRCINSQNDLRWKDEPRAACTDRSQPAVEPERTFVLHLLCDFPLGAHANCARSLSLPFTGSQFRRKFLLSALFAGLLFCCGAQVHAAENQLAIQVDQVGYPLRGPKVALVTLPAATFEVRRSSDNAVVFRGRLAPPQADPDTGDQVQAADFSRFRAVGSFYLQVPGVGRSWDFSISSNVFEHTYFMAMRAFYGQRCGTAVDMGPDFPGYSHPACHLHGEFHASSGATGPRNNVGGWHDAGDYGRYVVNSGISTANLMWAWELFAKKIKQIALRIPESGNGTPDILNEARWNLEWMLKMQDSDGGAWHKQTSLHFAPFVAPQDDLRLSEVIGTGSAPYKDTCSSADLAAVGAIAARVYKPYDAAFAARALLAARRAWAWTEKNPDVLFTRNPPGIATGEYRDSNCQDERFWAAAELWRATGEAAFNDYFLQTYAGFLPTLDAPPAVSQTSLAPMGLWTYALARRKGADAHAVQAIRRRTVAAARTVVQRTRSHPYHVSLQTADYV
jgi:endoglucanase